MSLPDLEGLAKLMRRVSELNGNDVTLNLLTSNSDGSLDSHHVTMRNDLVSQLVGDVRTNTMTSLSDRTLVAYDPVVTNTETVEFLPTSDVEKAGHLLADDLRASSAPLSGKLFHQVRAYTLSSGRESSRIIFVMRQPQAKIFRSDKVRLLFYSDSALTQSHQDALILSSEPDAIIFHDVIYIIKKFAFEIVFGYLEKLKGQASSRLSTIQGNPLFQIDPKLALSVANDGRRTRRLARMTVDHLDKLTVDICKRLKDDYHLNYEVREDKVVAESEQAVLDILKVVNDDLVESSFTDIKYDAQVKEPISAQ